MEVVTGEIDGRVLKMLVDRQNARARRTGLLSIHQFRDLCTETDADLRILFAAFGCLPTGEQST